MVSSFYVLTHWILKTTVRLFCFCPYSQAEETDAWWYGNVARNAQELKLTARQASTNAHVAHQPSLLSQLLLYPILQANWVVHCLPEMFYACLPIVLFPQLSDWNALLLLTYCLENLMDIGAWWSMVHGLANSWTRLGDWAHTCSKSWLRFFPDTFSL